MQEGGGGNINWASCQVGFAWNEHEKFVIAVYISVSDFHRNTPLLQLLPLS